VHRNPNWYLIISIKVYLAAICLYHIECGLPDPTSDDLLLLVCRGIRCLQGDHRQTRLPITINLMRTLKDQLQQSFYTLQEQRMLWAAFTMVFYGFLRVSEYINLRWCDVTISDDHISIRLHQSKTDPFQWRLSVKIFNTKSSTCPCHAFIRYREIASDKAPAAPLFQAGRFHPLSQPKTLCLLLKQAGLDESQYASHSFHVGAATMAAAAGFPLWLIKTLCC